MLVTVENFAEAIASVQRAAALTLDTETTGLRILSRHDRMVGVALLADTHEWYFPYRHASGNLPHDLLAPLLSALSGRSWTGHNCKFDMEVLLMEGVPLPPRVWDTMLAAHLANENEYVYDEHKKVKYRSDGKPLTSHALKFLADRHLGAGSSADESVLLAKLKGKKGNIWTLPAEDVAPYACSDVRLTCLLRTHYEPILRRWRLFRIWESLNEYCLITARLEARGFLIDEALALRHTDEAMIQETTTTEQLRTMLGAPTLNPNSPVQLKKLFNLKSTAVDTLEEQIVAKHPQAEAMEVLLWARKWSKVTKTYYDPILALRDPEGVLHPNLHMTGTVAGRLSCSSPNLQAIPRQNEIYKVKDIFVARPGFIIVSADYSQAEIRWGTHYAKERHMADLLIAGLDVHTATAEALKIPRFAAKQINFAVIYGVGAKSLADRLDIPVKQAKDYLSKYHKHYPGFKLLYNAAQALAERNGYIRMFTGRMRRYNAHSPERKASSNLIQGAVAEMLRLAIMRIAIEIPRAALLLQVHDQVLAEVPDNAQTNETVREIKCLMEDVPLGWDDVKIPMVVDIKVGQSWGGAIEWEA